jgi:leucine-zipper-like transcriptional regulator 1
MGFTFSAGYDGAYCGDFYQFNFATRTWSEVVCTGEPPSARYRSTCVVRGDRMVLFGGHDGNRHLNDTFVFDFSTSTWSTLFAEGMPPSPRDSHVAVVLDESMFVFGGSTGG